MVKGYFEKDETKKKELEEKMKNEVAPAFLKNMTTILTNNGGQWLVGKSVSLPDFYLKHEIGPFILFSIHISIINIQNIFLYS